MKAWPAAVLLFVSSFFPARADAALLFTDFTGVDLANNTAAGNIGGLPVSLTGTDLTFAVTDGSSTSFNQAFFTPPLTAADAVEFVGMTSTSAYTLTFGTPVQNPRLHLRSLGSALTFGGGVTLTKLGGEPTFVVAGNSVTGVVSGSDDANGTVQLNGTVSSVAFTATALPGAGNNVDGVLLQIGADVIPEPTGLTFAALAGYGIVAGRRRKRAGGHKGVLQRYDRWQRSYR